MKILYELSDLMLAERKKRHMTQGDFSKFLGVGENTLRLYELGNNVPNMRTAIKILSKLGYELKIEKKG